MAAARKRVRSEIKVGEGLEAEEEQAVIKSAAQDISGFSDVYNLYIDQNTQTSSLPAQLLNVPKGGQKKAEEWIQESYPVLKEDLKP